MNSSRTNNLIIALVIIAVIGGAYLFYQKNVSETALQAAPPVTTGSESSFVSLVGELSSVSLDPAILTDPRFTARFA